MVSLPMCGTYLKAERKMVLSKMRPRTKEKVTVVQLETFGIIFSISWENTGQVCLQDTDVRGFVRSEKGIIQKETI